MEFARLLLIVIMVAVSQAPSPESNPNPPLPVKGKVVHYTTFYLIGGDFVLLCSRVTPQATATLACVNNWYLLLRSVGLCLGQQLPRPPPHEFPRSTVGVVAESSSRY